MSAKMELPRSKVIYKARLIRPCWALHAFTAMGYGLGDHPMGAKGVNTPDVCLCKSFRPSLVNVLASSAW
jgi:hypothetical protein